MKYQQQETTTYLTTSPPLPVKQNASTNTFSLSFSLSFPPLFFATQNRSTFTLNSSSSTTPPKVVKEGSEASFMGREGGGVEGEEGSERASSRERVERCMEEEERRDFLERGEKFREEEKEREEGEWAEGREGEEEEGVKKEGAEEGEETEEEEEERFRGEIGCPFLTVTATFLSPSDSPFISWSPSANKMSSN